MKRADSDQLTPYLGPYDGFQRAAARQSRWMVVVVCSTATPALTATTTTTTGVVRRRYISNSRPLKMHKEVVGLARNAPLLLWRRTATSTDLEKYSAFYPIDAYPHIALLDSRTGERMQVWNFEPDVVQEWEDKRKQQKEEMEKAKEMESGKKSDEQSADNPSTDVAVTVEQNEETENGKNEIKEDENEEEEDEELPVPVWMTELEDFLESHSLKDDEVGPMHLGEKPAAARTRRVDSSRGASSSAAAAELQPTSIMDDEEAAIAAAIAASLKDVEGVASSDYEVEEEEDDEAEDQGDDNDENNDTDNAPCDEDVMADENGTEIMSVQPPTAQVLQPDDDGDDTMHDSTPSSADAATAAEGQTVSAMMDVEQSPETAVAEQAMDVVVDGDGDNDDEQQRLQTQASEQRVEEDNEQEQSEREGEDDHSSESDASMDSGLASTSTSTTRAPTGARTKPVPMPAAKPAASFSSSSSSSSSSSVFLKPGSDTSGTPPTAVPGKTPSRTFGPQPHTTGGAARTSSPRLASSVESVSSSYLERLSSTLRSSTDPALLESRRLRRMQDEELQASLQSDRAREAKLHQLNMAHARRRAAVMNAQARLAQVSSGPVEIVLRFNDGTRERRAFASDVMMRTLMDVIVVVTQGNCVCLGDEDVEFGGEDNVSVDRVLRYPLGGGRMPPMMMQKMGADAGQGMDLAQVSWDHRVVDVIKGNRAAFFVQS